MKNCNIQKGVLVGMTQNSWEKVISLSQYSQFQQNKVKESGLHDLYTKCNRKCKDLSF